MPLLVAVAADSLMLPRVGAVTVSVLTCTRMPSYFSSCSSAPAGFKSAAPSRTGGGSVLPVLVEKMLVVEEISVCDGLLGSEEGMNSCTVPVTHTELPGAAATGGVLLVNTKRPSEVLGLLSPGA